MTSTTAKKPKTITDYMKPYWLITVRASSKGNDGRMFALSYGKAPLPGHQRGVTFHEVGDAASQVPDEHVRPLLKLIDEQPLLWWELHVLDKSSVQIWAITPNPTQISRADL